MLGGYPGVLRGADRWRAVFSAVVSGLVVHMGRTIDARGPLCLNGRAGRDRTHMEQFVGGMQVTDTIALEL